MNKEAYLAGAYPEGTAKYKMAKKKYGPRPKKAPVVVKEEAKAPVVTAEEPVVTDSEPVVKKKTKKTTKKTKKEE